MISTRPHASADHLLPLGYTMLTGHESDVVPLLPMRACCWGSSARLHRLLPAAIGLGELTLINLTSNRPGSRL